MNIHTDNIKQYARKRISQLGVHWGGVRKNTIRPERDWKLALAAFTFLSIAFVVFSIYLFLQIDRGEIFLVEREASAAAEPLDETLLNETLLRFREKAQTFEELKTRKPELPDPSI